MSTSLHVLGGAINLPPMNRYTSEPKTEFAKRVREALDHGKLDLTQAAAKLSMRLGRKVKHQALQYIAQSANSSELTPDLAAITGVNYEWLRSNKGPKISHKKEREAAPDDDDSGWLDITDYKQAISTGDGSDVDEYTESGKLKFKASSFQKKGLRSRNTSVYYSRGDSMEPRIRQGDAILFDESDNSPKDDKIFVIRWKGGLHAKRLMQIGKDWFISSDNKDDPKWRKPKPIAAHDDFQIVGRVRWIGSWED